jgi:hypothetical protein
MQFAYYWPSINNECILACLGYYFDEQAAQQGTETMRLDRYDT